MQSLELSSIMSVGDVIEDEADVGESGFRSEFLKKSWKFKKSSSNG